jgi:hypothetical protein
MPVRFASRRVVHAVSTSQREQASIRPNPNVSMLTSWPWGDMLCKDILCGDMLIASNPLSNLLSNPPSLHLFVVEGTPVLRLGQTTAKQPRNSDTYQSSYFSQTDWCCLFPLYPSQFFSPSPNSSPPPPVPHQSLLLLVGRSLLPASRGQGAALQELLITVVDLCSQSDVLVININNNYSSARF